VPSQIFNLSSFPRLRNSTDGIVKPQNELIDLIRQTGNACFKKRTPAEVWAAATATRGEDAVTLTSGLMFRRRF